MSPDWLKRLQRLILDQHTPHGCPGRYLLWPTHHPRDRRHRTLWWQAPRRLPRPLWLMLQLWLTLRWLGWLALPACLRTLARHGHEVQQQHGIACHTQYRALRQLALGRCWPPALYYAFRLYLPGRHPSDYVAPAEMAAYHRGCDGGRYPAQLALLRDKLRSADILHQAGFSTARTLLALAPDSPIPDWAALGQERLFIKPRDSSRSQHCYRLQVAADGTVHWYRHPDGNPAGAEQAWRDNRTLHHWLVQPCYQTSPALQCLNTGDLTLRVITRQRAGHVTVTMAWLEMETVNGEYQLQPLALPDGQPLPPHATPLLLADWQQYGLKALPHWQQAAHDACAAHAMLAPDLASVAWDFVLPESGAVLLEGNSTWNVVPPQQLFGGLLDPAHPHNLT